MLETKPIENNVPFLFEVHYVSTNKISVNTWEFLSVHPKQLFRKIIYVLENLNVIYIFQKVTL